MKRTHFSKLFISRFSTYKRKAFSYVSWKPRNGQLAKMGSFHQSKRSDRKRYTMEVRWGIFLRIWRIFLFLKAVLNIPIQTAIIPYLISNGVCFSKIKIPYILTKPCHSLCPFSNLEFSFLRSRNSLEIYNGKLMGSKTHTSSIRARNFPQLTHSLRDCLRGLCFDTSLFTLIAPPFPLLNLSRLKDTFYFQINL